MQSPTIDNGVGEPRVLVEAHCEWNRTLSIREPMTRTSAQFYFVRFYVTTRSTVDSYRANVSGNSEVEFSCRESSLTSKSSFNISPGVSGSWCLTVDCFFQL